MKISRNSTSVVIALTSSEYEDLTKKYPSAVDATTQSLRASGEFTPQGFRLSFNKNGNGFYKSANESKDYRVQFTLASAKAKTIGPFGMSAVTTVDAGTGVLLLKLPAQLKALRVMRRSKKAKTGQSTLGNVSAKATTHSQAATGRSQAGRVMTDAELIVLKSQINEAIDSGFKIVYGDNGRVAYLERRI